MKKRTKLILEIVVVIALIGYVINIFVNQKRFNMVGVSDFQQSQMSLEGLNQFAREMVKPNLLSYPLGLISPDWEWMAYLNKDSYIEFASIQNPSKILFDPNPQKISNLIGWSPDGQAFLASAVITSDQDMVNGFSNIIIIYEIESDESIEKIEFDISSAFPYGEPFVRNLGKRITWSPDGNFIAAITNSDRYILIIDSEGNQVKILPIRDDKGRLVPFIDNLIWNANGLTFSYADSWHSRQFTWINVALDNPTNQVRMHETNGVNFPTVLGIKNTYILTSTATSQNEFELLLINTGTQQTENIYTISAREIIEASSGLQNSPYTVFTSKDFVSKDILWVFNWTTLELKQYYIENYFTVMGWSPALDGIGVLTEKNRKFELWVVKP